MPHSDGGQGGTFPTRHTFGQACVAVGVGNGIQFNSTTGRTTTARLGLTESGQQAIAFYREHGEWGGNVCQDCWGFRTSCIGTRIGQWAQALDEFLQ